MALCRECHHEVTVSGLMNEKAKMIHRKKLLAVNTDHETKRYYINVSNNDVRGE